MADISLSVGILGGGSHHVCLAASVCVWTCVFECQWFIKTPAGFVPSSSESGWACTQILECALLSDPPHSATWVCWFAVESPPNMSTRTILRYCVWKELEQLRKQPCACGLGTIGVECKWLWSPWQSTLFVNDWVEIWGEEMGSGSCD